MRSLAVLIVLFLTVACGQAGRVTEPADCGRTAEGCRYERPTITAIRLERSGGLIATVREPIVIEEPGRIAALAPLVPLPAPSPPASGCADCIAYRLELRFADRAPTAVIEFDDANMPTELRRLVAAIIGASPTT